MNDIRHPSRRRIAAIVSDFNDVFLSDKNGVVVVIRVFLDESGTHNDSQILSVSAVWASPQDWNKWTLDWIDAKAPIEIFHSVDCHNRNKEFSGWTREQRDAYVKKLLPVIGNHQIEGHFSAVDKREIRAILKRKHSIDLDERRLVEGYYEVCLSWALRGAIEQLIKRGHDNIAFVHEENQYGEIAYRSYDFVRKRFPDVVTSFSFGSKRAYPPLQCADIIAYEGNRQTRNFSRHRRPLQAIDPIGSRFGYYKYDKSEVEPLADFMAEFIHQIQNELD